MELNLPCDGKCEECQFVDCILTEEQALALYVSEVGEDFDDELSVLKERCGCGDRKQKDRARKKLYYRLHKDIHKERVRRYKESHKEYYREYEKTRKEYQRQYYLKRKELRNVEGKIVAANGNSGNIGTT